MYKVKYNGNGRIEVNLPSYPTGVIIQHGDYAKLNLKDIDIRVIKRLERLGLSCEKVEDKESVKKEEPKVEPVAEPQVEEVKEEALVEEPAAEESSELKKEDLMKKSAAQLKAILEEKGYIEVEGKSKSVLADKILEIVNGTAAE